MNLRSYLKLMTVAIAVALSGQLGAQSVATYALTTAAGATLDPMTGATIIGVAPNDDTGYPEVAIGFTFTFEGITYTDISVSPDGFCRFQNGPGTVANDFSNVITDGINNPKVFPWWDDLALGGAGLGGQVSTVLIGASPNQTRIVEWFVTMPRSTTGTPSRRFQLWINENGTIDFVYGGITGTTTTASVGLRGAGAEFLSVTVSTNTASSTTPNDANNAYPADGTRYTFTPPNCTSPAADPGVVVADCNNSQYSVDVNITSFGDATSLTVTDGTTPQQVFATGGVPQVVTMGPYASGSTQNLSILHDQDPVCDLTSYGTFSFTCPLVVSTFPYCEDFETATNCLPTNCTTTLACTSTSLSATGWEQGTGDQGEWSVDVNGTSSSNTGICGTTTGCTDFVPGTTTGKYLYTESGSPCNNLTLDLLSPIFDVSSFPNGVRAQTAYSMFGATTGSLTIAIEDPALSNNWTDLWTLSGDQGQGWFQTPFLDVNSPVGTQVRFRVRAVTGSSFTSDMAIDYFCVSEAPLCSAPIASANTAGVCGASTFDVVVDVTDLSGATSVDITSDVNGLEFDDVGVGSYTLTGFPNGSSVQVSVLHNDDAACDVDLGTFSLTVPGSITAGATETFDAFPPSSCSGNVASPLAGGWQNVGAQNWQVCAGPTSSTDGPSADHTGGGLFLYCESSNNGGPTNPRVLLSPCIDISGLTQPNMTFWYHMFGAQFDGSPNLLVEYEDPALSGNWNTIVSIPGNNLGDQWNLSNTDFSPASSDIRIRVTGIVNASCCSSDLAIDDLGVLESPTCTAATISSYTVIDAGDCSSFQVEVVVGDMGSAASLDILVDGLLDQTVTAAGTYLTAPIPVVDPFQSALIEVIPDDDPLFCGIPSVVAATSCPCDPAYTSAPGSAISSTIPTTSDVINIASGGLNVVDMNVLIKIDHTFLADLDITLTSPLGTVVNVMNDVCGGFDNMTVLFDDAAPTAMPTTCSNDFTGTYQTSGTLATPLSDLIGEAADGNWTLSVTDDAGGDDGILVSWCLIPQLGFCQPPAATVTVGTANCLPPSAEFFLDVDVTDLGSGTEVSITTDDGGGPVTVGPFGLGVQSVGPFASGANVNVVLNHENDPNCDISLGNYTFTCPPVVDLSQGDYCEDFEAAPLCLLSTCTTTNACTSTSLATVSWENATDDGNGNWGIDEGGTSSLNTGIQNATTGVSDYVPGTPTGNYVYMESGSCAGNTIVAISPIFDISSYTNPDVRARMAYSMYGATMGTLSVDIEDPAFSGTWTTLWTQSGDQGEGWFLTPNLDHTYTGSAVRYRVVGVSGTSFTSDMTWDYFCVKEAPLCTEPAGTLAETNVDCQGGTYDLEVTLTLGDATSVTIETDLDGIVNTATSAGTYLVGSYPFNTPVVVTLNHDQDAACTVSLQPFSFDCQPTDFCGTYSSSPGSQIINTNTPTIDVISTGPLSGEVVQDLDVVIEITHTFLADLDITLESPNGTVVSLMNDLCGGNDNMEIIFDDEAATPVVCAVPTVGRFQTSGTLAGPLSAFDTELFEGDWTLSVTDDVGGDEGILVSWCLVPTLVVPDCPSPSGLSVLSTTETSATLGWTPGAGNTDYVIEWGPVGFTLGTGTVEPVTPLPGPATITGLSGSTAYHFYLTELCPAGSSLTIGPATGTTLTVINTFPNCQDFESFSTCTATCNVACTFPVTSGWTNSTTDGGNDWIVDAGGTTSGGTGPSVDFVPGTSTGNYVYLETSVPCDVATSNAQMISPAYDVSGMVNDPVVEFSYHMFGATMGTLTVEIEDPAGSNNWSVLFTRSGQDQTSNAAPWTTVSAPVTSLTGTQFALRFTGTSGGGFTGDMALDYICVSEGPCDFPEYTYNVVCDNSDTTFTVEVNVTNVGSGPDVNVMAIGVDTIFNVDGTANPYVLGPYAGLGTTIDLKVENPSLAGCSLAPVAGLGCPPPNDLCVNEVPGDVPVSVGTAVTLSGYVNGSTDDAGLISGGTFPTISGYVWESFTVTECVDLVIDWCGQVPAWGNGSLNLYADCGGVNTVNSQSFNSTTCGDGNFSIFYNSLPPGDYYYPVFWQPSVNAVGFYDLNLTASAPSIPCTPNTSCEADAIFCFNPVSGTTVSNTPTQGPSVCLPNHTAPGADAWYLYAGQSTELAFFPGDGTTTTFDLAGSPATIIDATLISSVQANYTGDGVQTNFDVAPGNNTVVTSVTVNGTPQTQGSPPSNDFDLEIVTDQFGGETTWNVVDVNTTSVVQSGGPYASNSTFNELFTLPVGNYRLDMEDSFGDGMCCAYGTGSYELTNLTTATVIVTGGDLVSNGGDGFLESTLFDVLPSGGADFYLSAGTGGGGADEVIFFTAPAIGDAVVINYTSEQTLSDPADYSVSVGTGGGGEDQILMVTAPASSETVSITYGLVAGSQLLTASTCLGTNYNSMITVYEADPNDCNNLVCITGNDDNCGVADGGSQVNWISTPGTSYYIAVHGPQGFVNSTGNFTLELTCAAPCTPQANDVCATATPVTPVLGDGTGVAATFDNTCSFADANPSCSVDNTFVPNAFRAQGVWFSFNSTTNTFMNVTLLDDDNGYQATALSYALYDACGGNELACVTAGEGTTALPALTLNTDYQLMVYNNGGPGVEGTFGLLLEFPAQNDAAIDSITSPLGNLCAQTIEPVVVLRNNGQQPLTSVTITYDVDFGTPVVFNWTGNLAYGQTESVTLPLSTTGPGFHFLNVSTSLPNGVADELPGNDAFSNFFTVNGEEMDLVINTDNFGGETTWEIRDLIDVVVASGGPYASNTTIVETLCLPLDFGSCWSLYMFDSFGDGMCCSFGLGSWEIRDTQGGLLLTDLFHGAGTNPDGTTAPDGDQSPALAPASPAYSFGHEFCLPAGPAAIQPAECGIFTNNLQNKVYWQAVPGVTTYQAEFSDPDAGFRRRIQISGRNWVKFSEMVTSPLLPGTYYFARVRADQGNDGFFNDNWGVGCEMAIDPSQVPGCTQLIDNIGLPTHSCGVTKQFNGSDKVWAQPVVSATQYRFRFENAGEGFVRQIARPGYICLLSWTTLPLQDGITYDVTVECLVNGQWSGFCGAVCQVTIANPPAFAAREMGADAVSNDQVSLWPNPVRDGQVNLLVEGILDPEQRIAVEVTDMFGKRVLAQQYNNSGEVFNTILELDGLAAGIYAVNITINDRTTTQQIAVQ